MDNKSMTARVCAFSRAYHSENNKVKIFDDVVAKKLLSEEEYITIAENMSKGIAYFNKEFTGSSNEALRWVVDHMLSQTPLGRAAFAEKSLQTAVIYGARQYLICAAGYDTFAYRQPDWAKGLDIFELDQTEMSQDKQNRLNRAEIEIPDNVHFLKTDFSQKHWEQGLKAVAEYNKEQVTFVSFLGIIYYLTMHDFDEFLQAISTIIPVNSSIVFDYPNECYLKQQKKHTDLAKASNEEMQACYTYQEMEKLLEKHGFLIFEHLNADEMTKQYFKEHNEADPAHQIQAQENVNYCLAVKKY